MLLGLYFSIAAQISLIASSKFSQLTSLNDSTIIIPTTTKIGAVLVTVNTAYKIHEAEYLLRQLKDRVYRTIGKIC